MKDIRDILSYTWSVVCYPLFVSSYLMAAFCAIYSSLVMPLPLNYWFLLIGGTFLFSCLIPLVMLLSLMRMGHVDNLDVTNHKQRTLPYLYTLVSLAFWVAFLFKMHLPNYMLCAAIASLVCLGLVTLINLKWKISVHLSSFGGATATIFAMMLHLGFCSTPIVCLMLFMAWLLMLARIRLGAHTPTQAVAGYLLGLLVVLLPNIVLLYI